MTDILSTIKDAIDTFDFDTARNLLREALKNPSAEIYYLASQVALDNEQKTRFLQKSVEADPSFEKAVSELSKNNQYRVQELPESTPDLNLVTKDAQIRPKEDIHKITNPKQEYIIGKVTQNDKTLYRVPYPSAPIRTSLPANAQLAIIERTDSGKWINVFYIGTTNKPIIGWIPTEQVEGIALGTTQVQIMDLPITNFDYNTRDDIVDLKNIILDSSRKANILYATFMLLAIYCLIAAGITLALRSYDFLILSILGTVFFGALTINKYSGTKVYAQSLVDNIGWAGNTYEYMSRLDRLRKSKQDITENQMEFQATMQARQIAGGILTKVTPEFKDIMELTKRNNKNA